MGQVTWTDTAMRNVKAIMNFVAADSPGYARKLAERLREAPDCLANEPRAGSEVPEFGKEHVRELLVRPYRIIYVIRVEDCEVTAVVHASRVLTAILRPPDE